jgi:hypothetical protein
MQKLICAQIICALSLPHAASKVLRQNGGQATSRKHADPDNPDKGAAQ